MIKRLFLNDKFILVLIILNTCVLFLNGYLPQRNSPGLLLFIDNLITALFIVELVFKIEAWGFKTYFKSSWNRLDFVLVVVSIPALITFLFNIGIKDYSFLLVFRILRVFKAFRFFKFIPNVQQLIAGVKRAMKASVFILTGFIVYIFIIGIFSFYLFGRSGTPYFSDPLVSLYSIFKIFTVEGWFEIPESIIAGYSGWQAFFTYLYFIAVVLTGGIFGLSIVNSIFVDAMLSDNTDSIEAKIEDVDKKLTDILTKLNTNETRKDS